MKQLTIAITGINNHDNPGPGIPVARSLKESALDVKMIGFSYESSEPGIYLEDHFEEVYMIPYPGSGSESLYERIKEIHAIHQLDMIIPNFDAELPNFIRIESRLLELGIQLCIPTKEQFHERNKSLLSDFAKKYDLTVPHSISVNSIDEIHAFSQKVGYPLVVKGKFYEAQVVWSFDQAVKVFHQIASKWGIPIILQSYVKGLELNLVAIGDGKGSCLGFVPMRKIYVNELGKAWSGIVVRDQGLIEVAKNIIKKTNWNGPMELEVIKSEEDGSYQILEINPRFPSWVYLSVGAGLNLPELLVRHCLNLDNINLTNDYQTGTMFIRYSYDLICDRSHFEQISTEGNLSLTKKQLQEWN